MLSRLEQVSLVETSETVDALLLMRDSIAGLRGAVLPIMAIVLAFGAVRLWRERAPHAWFAGIARLWPGRPVMAPPDRSGPCATPSIESLPVDLDRIELLGAAKHRFVELQAAWDVRDLERLRAWTTPEMLDELLVEARGAEGFARTEVLSLYADLLGFDRVGGVYLASIEFSGTVRESAGRGAASFREIWMLMRPIGAAEEWRLARQQTLF